ncbi:heparinase II/III family protein [Clostridium baratii]|uniref:heparinase II/III domain-containing protein n=1 Tax=Clostridium baratii TaxID=1561 RepID=UPI00290629AB|nr:heparinase II/III family protein [Clostridium baratii]MDU4912103.1 heparinase II/III family protein [Clostridium baratii]
MKNSIYRYKEKDFTNIIKELPNKSSYDMELVNSILNDNTIIINKQKSISLYKQAEIWIDEKNIGRSNLRLLNGFLFIGDMLYAYEKNKDKNILNKIIYIIDKWFKENKYIDKKNTMAYHDETTALRMNHLLLVFVKLIKEDIIWIERLFEYIKETAEILYSEDFYAGDNNHGMFQSFALLKYSLVFDMEICTEIYRNKSIERLNKYFSGVYTKDGIAKEHSPKYHILITKYLNNYNSIINKYNINENSDIKFTDIIKNAENFIVNITKPNGEFHNISDTEPVLVESINNGLFSSDEYRYVVSRSKNGNMPSWKDTIYKDSGYAILRNGWTEKDSQVIFTAAYHGAYHKHTDDLNILFYSGRDIIVEAGPNGYDYKNKFTQYGYSSKAHNTLEVVNYDIQRHDGKMDKVKIIDSFENPIYSEVIGENRRYDGINHRRKVIFNKVKNLLQVTDYIKGNEINEYKLNWHLAKGLELISDDGKIYIYENKVEIGFIKVSSNTDINIKIVNGDEENVQGLYFNKMGERVGINNLELSFKSKSAQVHTEIFIYNENNLKFRDIISQEKTYVSKKLIKYILKEEKESDKLCIIFSSMNPKYEHRYSYVNTLNNAKINRLYILDDYGVQGSYYIGDIIHGDVENSVSSLINSIIRNLDIRLKDIIMIGNSKGGYSSIYYGVKYNVGNIIVGAPQYYLGDFLLEQGKHMEVAQSICGEDKKETGKKFLNEIMENHLLNNNIKSNILIHVGRGDYHYTKHIKPFINLLKSKNVYYRLDIGDYETHNELKQFFPIFLMDEISKIDNSIISKEEVEKEKIKKSLISNLENIDVTLNITDNKLYVVIKNYMDDEVEYAYYLFKDDVCKEKEFYKLNNTHIFELNEDGNYNVRIFCKKDGIITSKYTDYIKYNKEKIV